MPQVALFNQQGAQVGEINLNDLVFGIEPHKQAMFDAVVMQRASMRQGTHKTKTRTEVRGGGRKPWKQKGTGRARQGSIRSPQWRGGGVVFGPVPRSYSYSINKKVRRLALKSALASKVVENDVVVLDQLVMDAPKTKSMISVLGSLNVNTKAVIVIAESDSKVELSARNIPGVQVLTVTELNVLDLMNANKLVMTQDAVKKIEEVLA